MAYLTSGPADSLWAVCLLAVCLLACARAGSLLITAVPGLTRLLTEPEQRALAPVLGLSAAGLAILACGSAGWAGRVPSCLVLAAIAGAAAMSGRLFRLQPVRAGSDPVPLWFTAACAFAIALSLASALLPPTGTDALSYHLTHPRLFLENGRVGYLPNTRESMWPYATEMLFLWGLSLQGTSLATLFSWVYYPLTARAVYLLTLRFGSSASARASALVFLYTPALFAQSGQPYVDLSLACHVMWTAYGLALYWKAPGPAAAALAGIGSGMALGTKLLALGPSAVAGVLVWARSGRRARALVIYGCAALSLAGAWYLRSWLVLGNPVYPFFPSFFGGQGVDSDIANTGLGTGPLHFLLLPWNLTFYPDAFGGESIGPAYLMLAAPGLAWAACVGPAGAALAAFGLLSAGFVFTQSQLARFFLMLTPLGAAAAGWSYAKLTGTPGLARRAAALSLAAVTAAHAGIFLYRTREAWSVLSGRQTARQYLLAKDRSFSGHAYLAVHARPGQTVFNTAEPKYFYDPTGRMTMDNLLFRRDLERRGQTIEQHLDETGYDYIWTAEGLDPDVTSYALARGYRRTHAYSFTEAPATFRYVLYEKSAREASA